MTDGAARETDGDLGAQLVAFESHGLDELFAALREAGYTLIGPTVRDGAIVYDELVSKGDLPVGMTDEQEAGHYRLRRRDDDAYFGYVVGPHSWKRFLFPPRLRLWSSRRELDGGFTIEPEPVPDRPLALVGVRACELAAMGIQDRVFTEGAYTDAHYAAAREGAFLLAVNCVAAAPTCFCASMNTGPKVRGGDIALTEVVTEQRHYFVARAESERGSAVLAKVSHVPATEEEHLQALAHETRAAAQSRALDTHGLKDLIAAAQSHPHWDAVAERCLSCGNCTLVCPTCFCSTMEDTVDVAGEHTERWRRWDSCFASEHSYLHGGPVRSKVSSRYRQWLTHKLSTWHDQFDTSGCVGCGRCIAWCPVGIDLTAEAAAIRKAITG